MAQDTENGSARPGHSGKLDTPRQVAKAPLAGNGTAADQRVSGQQAWNFVSGTTTLEPIVPDARKSGLRGDARRTAEYLAIRGPTPVEALHNVARMPLEGAARKLSKQLGCSKYQAAKFWQECVLALLPYTAARLETLELGSNAAGGLALAHFLAASAMGARASADRQSVDSSVTVEIGSVSRDIPDDLGSDLLSRLPPKGSD